MIYGPEWRNSGSEGDSVGKAQIGTPEEMAEIVRDQIVAGIQSGKVKLIQTCNLEGLQPIAPPNADQPPEFPARRAAADDEDEPVWRVLVAYWKGDVDLDWEESRAHVQCCNIIDVMSKKNLLDYFQNPQRPIVVNLSVDDPDGTLGELIEFRELPDDDWLRRYGQHVGIEARECVAAGWRAAAVLPLKHEHGIQELLVSNMKVYADHQGFFISDDTLHNIARKMAGQWRNKDLHAHVFVNSSRIKKSGQP